MPSVSTCLASSRVKCPAAAQSMVPNVCHSLGSGSRPGVAVSPLTGAVYTANVGDDTVSVISA
jgi:DNA-binding beta-propeller fold protein YncE